ncbi:hypothetical protein BMETH_293_1 [methanotrophic bacterial endosymbiont of Bathymodiolus sp.]|nr:hypothetical protein BMETH_293_1 [methanotrophic bacterial endosymbiont of Bathymodiolus sp.]
MGKVGSPTGGFHPISSRLLQKKRKSPATLNGSDLVVSLTKIIIHF